MLKHLLFVPVSAAALLTLGIGVASAQLNLNWVDCANGGGAQNRNFACTSNNGTHQLISSFIAPAGVVAATGGDCVIDMQQAGDVLAPWWSFGGCRASTGSLRAINFSSDFSGVPGTGACDDLFGSALGGGFNFPGYGGPNRQRFRHEYALASNFSPMTQGNEVYFSRIRISNVSTVGGCAGCLTPACFVLNQINITQQPGSGGSNFFITAPADRNFVTWQGGAGTDCPGATPTRKATWGSVQSLYR